MTAITSKTGFGWRAFRNGVQTLVVALVALLGAYQTASAQQYWSIVAGRASDLDVLEFTRLAFQYRPVADQIKALGASLADERQKQLLGIGSNVDLKDILAKAKELFETKLEPTMLMIVSNRAADCDVATQFFGVFLGFARQMQLVGIDFGALTVNDPTSFAHDLFEAVKTRCLEDSFDACMMTGNGQYLVDEIVAAAHEMELLGIDTKEFEQRGVYLFRRCAVYQLTVHSEGSIDNSSYLLRSVQDNKILLLVDAEPSAGIVGLGGDHAWQGPRKQDPDASTEKITACTSKVRGVGMTCGQPMTHFARAQARIAAGDLKLVKLTSVAKVNDSGGVNYTTGKSGADSLRISYLPAGLTGAMTLGGFPAPAGPAGMSAYTLAHYDPGATFATNPVEKWTRVGHTTLFRGMNDDHRTMDEVTYADTSTFELVHRPDLFPADEIVAAWEIAFAPNERYP